MRQSLPKEAVPAARDEHLRHPRNTVVNLLDTLVRRLRGKDELYGQLAEARAQGWTGAVTE